MKGHPLTDEKKNEIIILLQNGVRPHEISEKVNVSYPEVIKISKVNGLSLEWRKQRDEKLRTYKSLGYSLEEVAEHFGVNVGVAQRACAGMPSKPLERRKIPDRSKINYRNQFTNGNYDQITNAKRLIAEANPEMEYVSGFKTVDKPVVIRHKVCGTEFSRSMNSIRHKGKTVCPVCDAYRSHAKKYASESEKRRAAAKRKQQRDLFKNYPKREYEKQIRHEQALINAERRKEEKREARRHDCPVCGTSTTRIKYCSDTCARKAGNAQHEVRRRHLIRNVTIDKDITLEGLFRRDSGRCWICGLPCDYDDIEVTDKTMVAGNMYPSIDHVIALSKGGVHSWENVKLAHRICNSDRYYAPQP